MEANVAFTSGYGDNCSTPIRSIADLTAKEIIRVQKLEADVKLYRGHYEAEMDKRKGLEHVIFLFHPSKDF